MQATSEKINLLAFAYVCLQPVNLQLIDLLIGWLTDWLIDWLINIFYWHCQKKCYNEFYSMYMCNNSDSSDTLVSIHEDIRK